MSKSNSWGKEEGHQHFPGVVLGNVCYSGAPESLCTCLCQTKRLRFRAILKRNRKLLRYSAVVTSGTELAKMVLSNMTRAISCSCAT